MILSGWAGEHLGSMGKFADEVRPMGDRLHLRVSDGKKLEGLLAFVFSNRLDLISLNPIRPSLEEHFQSLVAGRRPAAGVPEGA